MWPVIFILILPFLIIAILEELKEFFVNRYVLGPAAWEGKLKVFLQGKMIWLKKRFRKSQETEGSES